MCSMQLALKTIASCDDENLKRDLLSLTILVCLIFILLHLFITSKKYQLPITIGFKKITKNNELPKKAAGLWNTLTIFLSVSSGNFPPCLLLSATKSNESITWSERVLLRRERRQYRMVVNYINIDNMIEGYMIKYPFLFKTLSTLNYFFTILIFFLIFSKAFDCNQKKQKPVILWFSWKRHFTASHFKFLKSGLVDS